LFKLSWNFKLPEIKDIFKMLLDSNDLSNIPTDDKELDKLLPIMKPDFSTPPAGSCKLTWLGHSSLLLQAEGLNVLTDPIFSERASPVSFAGPKRYRFGFG
jgi:N-acyl-phosphatidylethanolamine-hydrolysing phospholipase D